MKNTQYFKNKEKALNKAKLRVEKKLNSFTEYAENFLHNPFYELTPEQLEEVRSKIDSFQWNDWHDLEYRISERLTENYFDYKSYLFEKNGFTTY